METDKALIKELLTIIQSPHIDELLEKYNNIEDLFFSLFHKKYSKTEYGVTLIRETVRRILYNQACKHSFYENSVHILYYLKFILASLDHECFYILNFNKKGYLISDKLQNVGTIDRVAIYPREVIKDFAYGKAPWGIMMVHNHPSGNPTPSQSDIVITKKIIDILQVYDVKFVEHIIVSNNGFTMMNKDGYL